MDRLMEWREKAKDWLSATTDEEIDEIFNVQRSIEPDVRHPEDFDWGDE